MICDLLETIFSVLAAAVAILWLVCVLLAAGLLIAFGAALLDAALAAGGG